MPKKSQSFFDPAPGEHLVPIPSASLARRPNQEPPSPRGKALLDEAEIQKLTIDGTHSKAIHGLGAVADINRYAHALFTDTVTTMFEAKEEIANKDLVPIVHEFTMRQVSMYGRQTFAALEVSAQAIGYEMMRPLYVSPMAPEPAPKKGFFTRLFGG